MCREVPKEGSMTYMFIYCIRICIHTYVYAEELCMYE